MNQPTSARIERRDLLVELGTEELPPKALPTLEQSFAEGMRSRLTQAGLEFGELESFATPRRLAVLVRRLPIRQPDQTIKRRGPPLAQAFDADGAPTRAAAGFAQSNGVSVDALRRERDAKGIEYLSYEGRRSGADTASLLASLVQHSLDALPIPKRMRWGSGEAQFVRPVHWLVMLFGRDVIPGQVLGVASGNLSYGHRFMAPTPIRLSTPAQYAKALRTRGKVVASFPERRASIRAQVEQLASTLNGRAIIGEELLDEVTGLVEWPLALAGRFEARFLSLPREVLLSTLQEHQRYFAVEDGSGALLPNFITISNIDSPDASTVRAGNERVIRPRLSDGAFFWEQDRRQPLAARRFDLDRVTFQAQLGSQGARTERIAKLAAAIAAAIGADAQATARAAQLVKCDLLTAMVGEFPELQGIMGRYYALADAEPAVVADTIRDHYRPRGAGDALPESKVGDALAIADKLDTLAGIFAIGHKPSGTRDPFGLRRAAIGVLRIALEHRLDLDLDDMTSKAVRLQPLPDIEARAGAVAREVIDFMTERLRAQYLERSDKTGITTEMFDAVLAAEPRSLPDFDERLRAMVGFVASPEGASLASANKRIANILRKSDDCVPHVVSDELLREDAERELHRALKNVRERTLSAVNARQYARGLEMLSTLRPQIDTFFDQVLVNDPDQALRNNRVALLAEVRSLFCHVADMSRLPG
ncbi:MAG TPA: glycine--tRNA ligase subunit beta [Steroidobacteraceae bacterium]|jgi:glycyl-tRNA synthetase beta chain|nr:glycine--tRNA ligase subunit beta [Steroidobacteraceae bacterium]